MSDENQTNNPDQPPVPSDEPLVKKDADGPKAKPDPIHWLLPILGYAYVPIVLLLASNQGDARGFLQFSLVVSLFGVPFYAAMLFGLNRMRNEHSRDQTLSRTEPDTSNLVDRLSLLCGRERCIRLLEKLTNQKEEAGFSSFFLAPFRCVPNHLNPIQNRSAHVRPKRKRQPLSGTSTKQ